MISIMVEPLVLAGTDTLPGELLACAGGVNVAQKGSRYPMWNMETVLLQDPDIIIVSPHPGTSAPENFFLRFSQLRAVRQEMVVAINADWLQRPGPRVLKGLEALREAILRAESNREEMGNAGRN
jgi:iron complex transport system substrate-binding protein